MFNFIAPSKFNNLDFILVILLCYIPVIWTSVYIKLWAKKVLPKFFFLNETQTFHIKCDFLSRLLRHM